jgi:4-carboxymuconolactone decarboxylase
MQFTAIALVVLLAQNRMPPIPTENLTPEQKKVAAEIAAGPRGALNGPFVSALRSPEFLDRLQKLGEYLRYQSAMGPKLGEMVILITARQWTQQYEWDAHKPLAVKAGLEPEVIAAIADGRRPAAMDKDEETVLDFLSELQQNKSVSDATYARAVKAFGEKGVVDMIGIAGYYSLLSMLMGVARTPLPDGKSPGLVSFPK